MIKRYIRSQVNRHGIEGFMMNVLEFISRITRSKKDDKMVADLKVAIQAVKAKKKK